MELNGNTYDMLNVYPFVNTVKDKNNHEFIKQRLIETELMSRQRNAVQYCKKSLGIKTFNITKIDREDKTDIENCLHENFLKSNPKYFGNRDVVFLDLYD